MFKNVKTLFGKSLVPDLERLEEDRCEEHLENLELEGQKREMQKEWERDKERDKGRERVLLEYIKQLKRELQADREKREKDKNVMERERETSERKWMEEVKALQRDCEKVLKLLDEEKRRTKALKVELELEKRRRRRGHGRGDGEW